MLRAVNQREITVLEKWSNTVFQGLTEKSKKLLKLNSEIKTLSMLETSKSEGEENEESPSLLNLEGDFTSDFCNLINT